MESALTEPRKTDINADFHVSTALFSGRLETRLFSKIDELPEELVKLIREAVDSTTFLDSRFFTTDTAVRVTEDEHDDYSCGCGCDEDYDAYEDDEEETYVTGLAVETFAFKDAGTAHDVIVSVVKEYVGKRKRVVSYI